MKKLRNEIVLIRKHEQIMDKQITNLEKKHTSTAVKLDRIELGMTALRKEKRILKRKIRNLESTSDNTIGKDTLNTDGDSATATKCENILFC